MKLRMDPEGDLSRSSFLLKAALCAVLVLSDLVISAVAAGYGFPLPARAVLLLTFAGLLGLELGLWIAVEQLFR